MVEWDKALRVVGQSVQAHMGPGSAKPFPLCIDWGRSSQHFSVSCPFGRWQLDLDDIEALDQAGRALRGSGTQETLPISDTLRVVGAAMRDLSAESLDLVFRSDGLVVRFTTSTDPEEPIELTYDIRGLAALRRAAATQRLDIVASHLLLTTAAALD